MFRDVETQFNHGNALLTQKHVPGILTTGDRINEQYVTENGG